MRTTMLHAVPCLISALGCAAHNAVAQDPPVANTSEVSTSEEFMAPPNTGDRRPPLEPEKKPAPVVDAAGAKVETPGPNTGRVHLKLGNDITTAYYTRGTLVENSGFITQPYGQVTFDAWKWEDGGLSAYVGMWNSFHSEKTNSTNENHFIDSWFEQDPYAGVQLSFGKWSTSVSYYYLNSGNGGFGESEEIVLNVTYDDSELLGAWSMSPGVTFVIETGQNSAHAPTNGEYLQLDLAPGFAWETSPIGQIDFTFPVQVGLGISNYFEDAAGDSDFFGFASFGAKAGIALPINRDFGVWTLSAGGNVIVLGDHNADYNNNSSVAVVGTVSLTIEY
jgi:hypothetical protein